MACLAPGRCVPASPACLLRGCTTWRWGRCLPEGLPRPRGSCARHPPATALAPCAATPDPTGAAGQTAACPWWRRYAPESVPECPHWLGAPPVKVCLRSRRGIPLLRRSAPERWPAPRCWKHSFAHPLAQQSLFQGGAFGRVVSLGVGDASRCGGLALDGPVGAAILAHRPNAADLVFQQGQIGAPGVRGGAGQRGALTGAPALMPELLVLALAAAGRVPDEGCFAAAAAHDVAVSKNIQD